MPKNAPKLPKVNKVGHFATRKDKVEKRNTKCERERGKGNTKDKREGEKGNVKTIGP